jgi:hypothetical protein
MYDLSVRYIELEKLAEKLQKDVERLTKELKVRKYVSTSIFVLNEYSRGL